VDIAAILAEMQAMWAEMNAMRQADMGAGAIVSATPIDVDAPISANNGGGIAQPEGAPQ
jgi:hypothetical protein